MSSIELDNGKEIKCIVTSMNVGLGNVSGFNDFEAQIIIDKNNIGFNIHDCINSIDCINIDENNFSSYIRRIEGIFQVTSFEYDLGGYRIGVVSNSYKIVEERSKLSNIKRSINKIKNKLEEYANERK